MVLIEQAMVVRGNVSVWRSREEVVDKLTGAVILGPWLLMAHKRLETLVMAHWFGAVSMS